MASQNSLAHRLYTGELSYDFIGTRRRWYRVSAVILLICLLSLLFRGLNLSIDFTGGSEFTVPTTVTATTVDEYRELVSGLDLPDNEDIKVNAVGDNQVRIQTRALSAEEINDVTAVLAEHAQVSTDEVTNNLIGASWGAQITRQGVIALVVFLALVSVLIGVYFRNWKMSVSAIAALLHDLMVTIGVYSILQFAFTPASLIGLLTILGYSLYDTVVVFDKVRESTRSIETQKRTFAEATNAAINQVLIRSINTTIIGVLPVAALLIAGVFILGTGPLKDLGLALFVGMVAGAYSSIFLAAPMFSQMKEREPQVRDHDERLAKRLARQAAAEASAELTPEQAAVSATAVTRTPGLAVSGDVVDPEALSRVSSDELRDRQQPKHTSRSQRRKDAK